MLYLELGSLLFWVVASVAGRLAEPLGKSLNTTQHSPSLSFHCLIIEPGG
uniref:Uncharacterized protein n=1 Tax=Anguilla anguilla TaxID=7936 RepID=A0A0E9URN9_ANGAN